MIATSRSDEPHDAFLPYKWQKRPGTVRFKRIDLNHDLEALKVLLNAERPTHVVNFAAQSEVAPSWDHPEHWFQTNTVALSLLVNHLRNPPVGMSQGPLRRPGRVGPGERGEVGERNRV